MTHANLLEELGNVVKNQPLWPGDTISPTSAYALAEMGLIRRGGEGNTYWFPTPAGLQCHMAGSIAT